jgi:plasmid stability protein
MYEKLVRNRTDEENYMAKKMISLEISDELREALRIEAFKRSLSISALIRQLLEQALSDSAKESDSK